MTDRNSRKRGVTVELLDYELLVLACRKNGISVPSYMANGILRRLDGGAAVIISSEGVASTKIQMGMIYLDTESWDGPEYLPIDDVEECRTGETKDLADHIRTFGSRLDVNHWDWSRWVSEETH